MSFFKGSPSYISRELAKVPPEERPRKRLEIAISDLLTGPTSSSKADELANKVVYNNDPKQVAEALIEAGERYLSETDGFEPAQCQTVNDADNRIQHARLGSLFNASLPYMRALREGVIKWLAAIEQRIAEKERQG